MHFTFEEWELIRQAVRNWKDDSEEQLKKSTPSDEELSMYQIFKRQTIDLTNLYDKIMHSVI